MPSAVSLQIYAHVVGGSDEALSPTQFDAVTKERTGRDTKAGSLPKDTVGRVTVRERHWLLRGSLRREWPIVAGRHLIAMTFGNCEIAIAVRNRPIRVKMGVAAMLEQENGQLHWTRNTRRTRLPPLNVADI